MRDAIAMTESDSKPELKRNMNQKSKLHGNPKLITSKRDLETYLIQLLKSSQKVTTVELVSLVEKTGRSCPDEPVRFLNKLRMEGKIKGELSKEQRGWLWWV